MLGLPALEFVFRFRFASIEGLEIFVNEGNLRKILSRISIRLTFSRAAFGFLFVFAFASAATSAH